MPWKLSKYPDGTWLLSGNETSIHFVDSVDNLANIRYQNVLLNLAKWDQYWQQDQCNFVPANLNTFPRSCCDSAKDYADELAMHQQKIQRWQKALEANQTNRSIAGEVPAVCFCDELIQARLRIRQGRHRIAYLRQIGAPCFAAAIPITQIQQVVDLQLIYKG